MIVDQKYQWNRCRYIKNIDYFLDRSSSIVFTVVCQGDKTEMVEELVLRGSDINAVDNAGLPLASAAKILKNRQWVYSSIKTIFPIATCMQTHVYRRFFYVVSVGAVGTRSYAWWTRTTLTKRPSLTSPDSQRRFTTWIPFSNWHSNPIGYILKGLPGFDEGFHRIVEIYYSF